MVRHIPMGPEPADYQQMPPNGPPEGFNNSQTVAETWGPQYERTGRYQQGGVPIQQSMQAVFGNLQQAERLMETQGVAAAEPAYYAAISAARSIDQNAVSQELQQVTQALQNPGLDPTSARMLQQEALDLHTLQRAPGFTEANLGLALLRSGQNAQGVRILREAAQLDPQMQEDPNFQRHLQSALQTAAQMNGSDAYAQPQAQPGNSQLNNPGAPADSRAGQVGPATDNTQSPSSALPQGQSPWQIAQALAGEVTGPNSLTPQMQQEFQQVIAAADSGQSPLVAQLQPQVTAAEQQVKQLLTPQVEAAANQNTTQIQNAINNSNLSSSDKQMAQYMLGRLEASPNAQTRQQLEQALGKVPGVAPLITQRDQILGPNLLNALYQFNTLKTQLQDEQDQGAMTRYAYALALNNAGDSTDAATMMADAVNHSQIPENKQMLDQVAAQMGVQINQNGDAVVSSSAAQPAQPGNSGIAQPGNGGITQPGAPGSPSTTGEGSVSNPATTTQPGNAQINQPATATGNPMQLLQTAESAFEAAKTPQDQLTAVKQQANNYQAAMQQSDAVFQQALAQRPANWQQAASDLQTQAGKLSQQDQQTLQGIESGKITGDQMNQFLAAHPQIKNDLVTVMQEAQFEQAANQKMLAALLFANALATVNDTTDAKTVMQTAFQDLPQDMAQQYQKDQSIAPLLQKLGLSGAAVAGTAGDSRTAGSPTTTGAPAEVAQPGAQPAAGAPTDQSTPTTDMGKPIPADVLQLAQNNNLSNLLQTAELKAKTNIKDAIPYYQAASAIADNIPMDQLNQQIATAQKALQTGTYTDSNGQSQTVTPQIRQQLHQQIQQDLQLESIPTSVHEEFALMLKSAHMYSDAEQQYTYAIQTADKINVQAAQAEVQQLNKDMNDPSMPQLWRAQENATNGPMQQLQALTQVPINIREEAARFYLGGGKNPDGSTIGDLMIAGYDKKTGQPIIPPTGVATTVLDPQKAADLVNQAAALQKSINGVDIDQHPDADQQLSALRAAVLQNSPDSLKKSLQQAGSMWKQPASTVGSTLIGMGVVAGLALLTRGRSLEAEAGAGEGLAGVEAGLSDGAKGLAEAGTDGARGLAAAGADGAATTAKLSPSLGTALKSAIPNVGNLTLGDAGRLTAGFGAATVSNYGLNHALGNSNYSMTDALVQGGGTFAALEGGLMLKDSIIKSRLGGVNAAGEGQQLSNFFEQGIPTLSKDGQALTGSNTAGDLLDALPKKGVPSSLTSVLKANSNMTLDELRASGQLENLPNMNATTWWKLNSELFPRAASAPSALSKVPIVGDMASSLKGGWRIDPTEIASASTANGVGKLGGLAAGLTANYGVIGLHALQQGQNPLTAAYDATTNIDLKNPLSLIANPLISSTLFAGPLGNIKTGTAEFTSPARAFANSIGRTDSAYQPFSSFAGDNSSMFSQTRQWLSQDALRPLSPVRAWNEAVTAGREANAGNTGFRSALGTVRTYSGAAGNVLRQDLVRPIGGTFSAALSPVKYGFGKTMDFLNPPDTEAPLNSLRSHGFMATAYYNALPAFFGWKMGQPIAGAYEAALKEVNQPLQNESYTVPTVDLAAQPADGGTPQNATDAAPTTAPANAQPGAITGPTSPNVTGG